jgi:transcriptional antiterminator NusG
MEDEKEQTDLSGTPESIEGEPLTTAEQAPAVAPELEGERPADVGEEATLAQTAQTPPPPREADGERRWYIVHTYSGYEQKVKQSIEKQIARLRASKLDRDQRLAGYFGEILIPTENVVELVKGQRRTTSRKFFPGYILVQMEGNQESWHLVRETPKISGFVGGTKEPTPITEEELNRILRQEKEGAERPKPKIQFERGENVRVVAGPFANFTGVVEDVKPEKAKVKVLVTIFGRATPVELSFIEVEKA